MKADPRERSGPSLFDCILPSDERSAGHAEASGRRDRFPGDVLIRHHPAGVGFVVALVALAYLPGCGTETEAPELPPRVTVDTDAGGPLRDSQAAYDVRFYELDLEIDPASRSIAGTVRVRALARAELAGLDLDLDDRFTVAGARHFTGDGDGDALAAEHTGKKLWIPFATPVAAGDEVTVEVAYSGAPREAPNPPWEGGFTWQQTDAGAPWIGVSCQIDGCDVWWPCKDHPSDEPDEGAALHYTVPPGLEVVANGVLEGVDELEDGRRTFHWRVSTPINSYNVTFNAAPFVELTADYESVTGEPIPFSYWLLPEDVEEGRALLPELVDHLRFLEELLGPYPFRADKYAVVETPYIAMEHQTAIAYGRIFGTRRMGFEWIAFHELAHEWWGNLVSASDWRDFWLHEGFDAYTEALYVERLHGPRAYHEYLQRFLRPSLVNQRPVAPREERSIRQVYYALPPDYTQVDRDMGAKGALVLHALRYLLGDDTFLALLRRQAYPDPALEAVTDGSHTRITSTDDFLTLAEQVSGRKLDWFFEVYLRQPELPRLVAETAGDRLTLRWQVPGDLPFPMPVDVHRGSDVTRLDMTGGRGELESATGTEVEIDPDFWILRAEAPDPDRFGTLGADGASVQDALAAAGE